MCSIIGHLCFQKNNALATDSIQINSLKNTEGEKKQALYYIIPYTYTQDSLLHLQRT